MAASTDFDLWLAGTFRAHGDFTTLVVLVRIAEPALTPLASTFLTVVGDEVGWPDMVALLSGSGRPWDGAAFFAQLDDDGPLDNGEARARLRALEQRIAADRLVINSGDFFDARGRRLKVEEISPN
ncbi:hypothetical protein ACI7BZ_11015 [Xanthobacter sp. AM11]|uniref:hypothetical protein n=1 Tax=Xanthobacter sp. AM11 TaxID=3380643 RepID=UPI0039BFA3D4